MIRVIVIASLIAQVVGPLQLQAMCESFSADEQIEFFPLAEMESEINDTLKTTAESGERKAVLVIKNDRLPALSQELTEEINLQPSRQK